MIEVIIPAYNCADTLGRTLASLAAQTIGKKFLVTVVNDNSQEDLSEIIEIYSKVLPIKYITLPQNLGFPGLVRQVGIDNSMSDYITFVDADDILAPNAIETFYNHIRSYPETDLVFCFFHQQDVGKAYVLRTQADSTWLHGKLYSRKFLEKYNIRFSAHFNEDGGFNNAVILLATNKYIINEPIYFWMANPKSITRSEDTWMMKHATHVVDSLLPSYQTVIKGIGLTDKVAANIGEHLIFFYNFYCKMVYYRAPVQDRTDFLYSVKRFAEELELYQLCGNVAFKKSLLAANKDKGVELYEKHITISNFLQMANLIVDFSVETLIEGE